MNKPNFKKRHNLITHDGSDKFYDMIDNPNKAYEVYESTEFHNPINSKSLTFHYNWHTDFPQSEGIEIQYINVFFEDETMLDDGESKRVRYYREIK